MADLFKDNKQFEQYFAIIQECQEKINRAKYESNLAEQLKGVLTETIRYIMIMFAFPKQETFDGIMKNFGMIGILVDDIIFENEQLKRGQNKCLKEF